VSSSRPSTDLASLPEMFGALKRWGWIAVAAALVAAGGAWFLTRPASGGTATVRLAVDRTVSWPYYDIVRQRPTELIKTNDIVNKSGASSIEVEAPPQQAYIDLKVSAGDPNAAVQAADKAAQELMAANRAWVADNAKQRIAQVQAEVDALNARVGELEGVLAGAVQREGEEQQKLASGNTGGNNAGVLSAQAEREKIQRERSDVASQAEQRRNELIKLNAQVTAPENEIGIVTSAAVVNEGGRSKRTALLAFLLVGGLATLALPLIERLLGKASNRTSVERALGRPVLAGPSDGDELTLAAIVRANARVITVMGADAGAPTAAVAQRLQAVLQRDRTRERIVVDAGTRLADAVMADAIVVVVGHKKTAMRALDRVAADVDRLDLPVLGAVLA
jgi:hypothetical protein